jgi:hypothetical protein
MSYDIAGNVVRTQDPNGRFATQTPTAASFYAAPSVITAQGNGNWAENFSYTTWLAPAGHTGPNGFSESISYDTLARPATRHSPYGAPTSYTYTQSPPAATATTNGRWVRTTMDGFGRTIKSEKRMGGTTYAIVETEYDAQEEKSELTFWGVDGRRMGTYRYVAELQQWQMVGENLYFAGKLVRANGAAVVVDRLGSVVSGGRRYFPHGEARTPTANGQDKFATYYRDLNGLDYADQRYYWSAMGR